ncbi:hypothetical protein [Brachyspira pilosicoli]|uniref:hypothetical protein n=1 Tax=Brachyspira pilosicoli TaxID=52584 RepID=UPI0026653D32|nr:hypothetical protein [Brachyspira pilosicoli]
MNDLSPKKPANTNATLIFFPYPEADLSLLCELEHDNKAMIEIRNNTFNFFNIIISSYNIFYMIFSIEIII